MLNEGDGYGRRPLHYAAAQGNTALLRQLLHANADPLVRCTQYGASPLHLAASLGRATCCEALLVHASRVRPGFESTMAARPDFVDRTPLHYAVRTRQHECMRLLACTRALRSVTLTGVTPLLELLHTHDDPKAVAILLYARADPSIRTASRYSHDVNDALSRPTNGLTALHLASSLPRVASAAALLAHCHCVRPNDPRIEASKPTCDLEADTDCSAPVVAQSPEGDGYMVSGEATVFCRHVPRFAVGDRVQFMYGGQGWIPGTVHQLYRPNPDAPGAFFPYVLTDDRAAAPRGRKHGRKGRLLLFTDAPAMLMAAPLVTATLAAVQGGVKCTLVTLPPSVTAERFREMDAPDHASASTGRSCVSVALSTVAPGRVVVTVSAALRACLGATLTLHVTAGGAVQATTQPRLENSSATGEALQDSVVDATKDTIKRGRTNDDQAVPPDVTRCTVGWTERPRDTPLTIAAELGELGTLGLLLERGCHLVVRGGACVPDGSTPREEKRVRSGIVSVLRECLEAREGSKQDAGDANDSLGIPPAVLQAAEAEEAAEDAARREDHGACERDIDEDSEQDADEGPPCDGRGDPIKIRLPTSVSYAALREAFCRCHAARLAQSYSAPYYRRCMIARIGRELALALEALPWQPSLH